MGWLSTPSSIQRGVQHTFGGVKLLEGGKKTHRPPVVRPREKHASEGGERGGSWDSRQRHARLSSLRHDLLQASYARVYRLSTRYLDLRPGPLQAKNPKRRRVEEYGARGPGMVGAFAECVGSSDWRVASVACARQVVSHELLRPQWHGTHSQLASSVHDRHLCIPI